MRRLLALLALVGFLWPAAAQAAVALCAISGTVYNPDGSTLNNGVVQFDSKVTQVVGSTTIPPSIISTTTDANGNMAPMSVAQGLFGTFTFCQGKSSTNVGGQGGGCAAPINGLIPINTTGNIQAVIAGTLLPSVGNATVNNLTATANVNVGGQMQTQTLLVNGNSTLTGTLTTGAVTAPTINLTKPDCSALTLAQATITSNPSQGDLMLTAGGHCLPSSGGWVADANSAVGFGNYYVPTGSVANAGWQWLGNTGLTPGSSYTPTLLMTLAVTPALVTGLPHAGTLTTNALALQSTSAGTPPAISFFGGSIDSGAQPNMNFAAGAHVLNNQWVADATTAMDIVESSYGGPPSIGFDANSGLTVGAVFGFATLGTATQNGWTLYGTNPALIALSNTNNPADIFEVQPQNGTQGIGMTFNGIHSIGTLGTVTMTIDAKGGGNLMLNTINVGGPIDMSGSLYIQRDEHLSFSNNSVAAPGLTTCSAGSLYATSTDNVGQVNFSAAGAGSCAMNFGKPWAGQPLCVCSVALSSSPWSVGSCVASESTTALILNFNSTIANGTGYADWVCMGTL